MIGDPYEALGVSASATNEEIKRVYRDRIRRAHLDMPTGDEALARQLNDAYAIVGDPKGRRAYDEAMRRPTDGGPELVACPECGSLLLPFLVELHLRQHMQARMGPSCSVCGRWPTEDLRLTMHSGFVLFRQKREFNGPMCRSCGRGFFREAQAHNLSRGWWGIFSFVATFFSLFGNWAAYQTFRNKVAPPRPSDPATENQLEGRPVFVRPAVLIVMGIFAFVAFTIVSDFAGSTGGSVSPGPTPPTPTSPPVVADPYRVGSCVDVDGEWVEPASSCTGADGIIIAVERMSANCPATTDFYITKHDGRVACISGG